MLKSTPVKESLAPNFLVNISETFLEALSEKLRD
jgi:hypothetical protein